jgi:hypothetical protein
MTDAITDADVRALAAKLKGLHTLLTPAEQALLHLVLRRAAGRAKAAAPPSAPADPASHSWAVTFNPFTYLDAIAGALSTAEPRLARSPRRQPCDP